MRSPKGGIVFNALILDVNHVLSQHAGDLMDLPSLSSSMVDALFAQPILLQLRLLASASHTSRGGRCVFELPMPVEVFAYIAPGTGLPEGQGTTEFTRPSFEYQASGIAGQLLEPPSLIMTSRWQDPRSLDNFLGKDWDSFVIREDSDVGGFKVSTPLPPPF